jgi:hypothetical protein
MWQILLAQGLNARLNPFEPLVLGLAVWCVYAGDQVLDALRPVTEVLAPARKRFYRENFRMAWKAGLSVAILGIPLSYELLGRATFHAGLLLTMFVVGYFGLVHLLPSEWRSGWPREAAVALLFTTGTFLGVWVATGEKRGLMAGPALLFALLCWANVSAIETWEWQIRLSSKGDAPSGSARWIAAHLKIAAYGIAVLAILLASGSAVPLNFAIAACGSGIAMAVLAEWQDRLPVSVARVAADAALCTPLLTMVFGLLR